MTERDLSSRRLMWAGFLGVFVWGSIAGLLGAILPALRERSGITLSESAGMFVALSSGLVVASIAAGILVDRIGKKKVLCTAVGLVVIALILFELTNRYVLLIGLAFLMGAGGSAVVTAGHTLIADLNPHHRAASLNLLDLFFGLGAFVTPFAIVPLQQTGGLRSVLFALAGLAAAVLVYLLTVRFPPPARAREASFADAGHLAGSAMFLLPAALIFLYVGTEQSVWDWQVTYFMQQLSMSNVAAARTLSIFPIAIMVGRLVNNRLLLRVSPTPVLIVSTASAALCFAVILLSHSSWVAIVALFVAGLFMASIYPTTLGLLSARFPERSGTALGLAITGGWLGSVVVSPAFGFVAHAADYSAAYLVIVGVAVAMTLTAVMLQRQYRAASGTARADLAAP